MSQHDSQQDKAFLRSFSIVIAALALISIGAYILAVSVTSDHEAVNQQAVDARIKPVGEVATAQPIPPAQPVATETPAATPPAETTTAPAAEPSPPPAEPAPVEEPATEATPPTEAIEATKPSKVTNDQATALIAEKGYSCMACHQVESKLVGPSYKEVGAKYKGDASAAAMLAGKIKAGGVGSWGQMPMPPNPTVTDEDMQTLVGWILSLE